MTWTWGRWTQYEFVKSRHCHWKCNKNIRFIFWYFSKLLKYLQFRFSLIDNQFQHWPNRFQHVSVTLLAHYNTPGIPRCASHYIALQYPCCASHVHLFLAKASHYIPLIASPLGEGLSIPTSSLLFSCMTCLIWSCQKDLRPDWRFKEINSAYIQKAEKIGGDNLSAHQKR